MLKNNTIMKIVSLLFAIILWMYVMGEVNPTITDTIEDVPVKLLNTDTLEQRDLAVQGADEFTVDVEVTGKRAEINELRRSDFKATANIFGYEEGVNDVPVLVEPPDNVTLTQVKPSKIEVILEELVSVYKPINVVFEGKAKEGTEPGNISTSPTEIEIKGAKSTVNSVIHVNAPVNATKVTDQPENFTATPVAVDHNGDPVDGVELSASTVDVTAVLYQTKKVPLKVEIKGSIPSAYELISMDVPDEITIRGPENQISEVDTVKAKPVDVSKVTASTSLPITPILPGDIEVANDSKNISVDIKIKGLTTRTFTLSTADSEINNLDAGLTANINTPEVIVKVSGNESIINSLDNADFSLSVDLGDLKAGTRTVPISVKCSQSVSTMKIQPTKVEITINKE